MIDVNEESEYQDMANHILYKKPKKVFIAVEMDNVKKGCKKHRVCEQKMKCT